MLHLGLGVYARRCQDTLFEGERALVTSLQKSIILYVTICVFDFAERFGMDVASAYGFLERYGGIDFLLEFYDIEHTLGVEDALDDLEHICRRNGGAPSRVEG